MKMICRNATSKISYAWGIDRRHVNRLVQREITVGNTNRKIRNDAGQSFLNSENRRVKFITARTVFLKAKRIENRGNEPLTRDQIESSWLSLSDASMHQFQLLAVDHRERCKTLLADIGSILRRTRGRLTWQQLTSSLCGEGIPFISHVSIADNIMKLPESRYTTTRIFPLLNEATKKRRLEWALNFWVFWNSAKLTSTIVLLCHMDEKWFYSLVTITNNKWVPFLGMDECKVSSSLQHKYNTSSTYKKQCTSVQLLTYRITMMYHKEDCHLKLQWNGAAGWFQPRKIVTDVFTTTTVRFHIQKNQRIC